MRTFATNIRNELKKLTVKKKYFVMTIIGIIIAVIRIGMGVFISKISGGEVVIKSNLMLEMVGFVVEILAPLVIFMAVTDLLSSEIQEGSLKASLLGPIARLKLLGSKLLAVYILSSVITYIMLVVAVVIQLLSGNGVGTLPQTILAYMLDTIPYLSLIALTAFINMIAKGPTLSMLLSMVVYVFFKYLNYYVSPVGQMIFTAYSQWHKMWIGTTLPFSVIMSKIGILFGSVLILFTLSYIIFDSKDY